MTKRILVFNDSQEILQLFRDVLQGEGGYEVELLSALNTQTLDKVKERSPDLVIVDHVFGDEKIGWDVVQTLKLDCTTREIPVIICSGAVKELREIEGLLKEKDIGLLYKPFDIDELLDMVEHKLGKAQAIEVEVEAEKVF